jgi:hypothetical protein
MLNDDINAAACDDDGGGSSGGPDYNGDEWWMIIDICLIQMVMNECGLILIVIWLFAMVIDTRRISWVDCTVDVNDDDSEAGTGWCWWW